MRAYYFDNLPGDQRLPHDYIPSRPVSAEKLTEINVKFWQIPVEGYEPKVDAVAKERGYKNRDLINVTKEGLGDVRIPIFLLVELWHLTVIHERFTKRKSRASSKSVYRNAFSYLPGPNEANRHMHEDEEIRYILSGSGFFDVRGSFPTHLSPLVSTFH